MLCVRIVARDPKIIIVIVANVKQRRGANTAMLGRRLGLEGPGTSCQSEGLHRYNTGNLHRSNDRVNSPLNIRAHAQGILKYNSSGEVTLGFVVCDLTRYLSGEGRFSQSA